MINEYTQGRDNHEIFASVGAWLVSSKVQKELGGAVTSTDGDLWHIAADASEVRGFSVTHPTSQAAHVKVLYVAGSNQKTRLLLLQAVLASSKRLGAKTAYTHAKASDPVWERAGFTIGAQRGTTSFYRWEIQL